MVNEESKNGLSERLRRFTTLDGADIIQVDAAVIVGVLIFLTLTSFLEGSEEISKLYITLTTSVIVLPFSMSAMTVLLLNFWLHHIRGAKNLTFERGLVDRAPSLALFFKAL